MKRFLWIWSAIPLCLGSFEVTPSLSQETVPGRATTSQDQQSLMLTIYNSNLGLIKDIRKIELDSGISELRFMDVASQINPATVHIKSLNTPVDFSVQEQNYEYDLLNPQKLLDKYVGKEVTLVRLITENNSTAERVIKAKLLSNNGGQLSGRLLPLQPGSRFRWKKWRNQIELSNKGEILGIADWVSSI